VRTCGETLKAEPCNTNTLYERLEFGLCFDSSCAFTYKTFELTTRDEQLVIIFYINSLTEMRIFSFLIAAALASIGYAIVSAGDIVTSLDSIAKQISEADAQAKSSTTLDLITGSIVSS
jgi:hypothetical protein